MIHRINFRNNKGLYKQWVSLGKNYHKHIWSYFADDLRIRYVKILLRISSKNINHLF